MMKKKLAAISVFCILLSLFAHTVYSQESSLSRKYTPVVFPIGDTPLAGQHIDSLALYRYSSAEGWVRIPFQIDEVLDANGKYAPEDSIADSNDEVVFLSGDVGGRATTSNFGPDAALTGRWEIEVVDPLDTGKKGWVYLFKKTGNEESITGYMSYSPSENASTGTDSVSGISYLEGHGPTGWIADVHIKQNDVYGPDIVDQQKLRVKGNIVFLGGYELNEADDIAFDSVQVNVGQVRVFRRLFMHIVPPFNIGGLDLKIDLETLYYPYSSIVSARNAKLEDDAAEIARIELIRQSVDLSDAGMGMQFFSDSNAVGIQIDGNGDSELNSALPVSPDAAILAANGQHGMLLNIIEVPVLENSSSQHIYFHEDASGTGSTADGTGDTGDNNSYGDFGIRINGNKIKGQVSLDFLTFYLEQQTDPLASAQQIRDEAQNPLNVSVIFETKDTSPVGSPAETPGNFVLHDAYPNPFFSGNRTMRLSFELKNPINVVSLTVYNLLGQAVAKIVDARGFWAGSHEISWDGRNFAGRLVPAGVYFYALEGRFGRHVKKVLIVR